MPDLYVLGLSGYLGNKASHDAACALLRNGEIVAMAEEERYNRRKRTRDFPVNAINFCLKAAGITVADVAAIGVGTDPRAALRRYLVRGLVRWLLGGLGRVSEVLGLPYLSSVRANRIAELIRANVYVRLGRHEIPIFYVDHHLAHAASAYFTSGFSDAAVLTWDGGGDGLTGMLLRGRGDRLEVLRELDGRHLNVGLMYQMASNYLNLSDEGSLMGLASYGRPNGALDKYVDWAALTMHPDLRTSLNMWPDNTFHITSSIARELGAPRLAGEPIKEEHKVFAANVQDLIERIGWRLVDEVCQFAGSRKLCMAGGVALNAVFNGKLARSGKVEDLFVVPCPEDGGTALGAAFIAHQRLGGKVESRRLAHAYWGPEFTDQEIQRALDTVGVTAERLTDQDVIDRTARLLVNGAIVGWFQGRAEWGPRALGNRSILADPRREEIRERVNEVVKYRDEWRPFAPSMLEKAAEDYLGGAVYAPFMLLTFPVQPLARRDIPAVVHVDGTTRPQLVRQEINPRYYAVIQRFSELSGVPALLNTSFNLKGEPIVNAPIDALRCFWSSGLDLLVMGNYLVQKPR